MPSNGGEFSGWLDRSAHIARGSVCKKGKKPRMRNYTTYDGGIIIYIYIYIYYVTRYDHSLSNDNAEKMAKIHGQVGIYGIGNESSMGKYNHLPTVWQKQGLSATFVDGALPPLLPRAVNRHGHFTVKFRSGLRSI